MELKVMFLIILLQKHLVSLLLGSLLKLAQEMPRKYGVPPDKWNVFSKVDLFQHK
jgi:hypothetical protein